jgi:TonB family protein
MQVEFRDRLPEIPKPEPKKEIAKPVAKKAKKAGIAIAKHAPAPIHPVKKVRQVVAKPLPKTRASQVKMPKFVPHAADEDVLAAINRPQKLATATTLRAPSNAYTPAPKLVSKGRGVRVSDVQFELHDKEISGVSGHIVNIPIGERSDVAVVAYAQLHNAPRGLHNTSSYKGPLGEGVGELAGKNRKGYIGKIQVSGIEPTEDAILAAGNSRGKAGGKGVEIGGPVGDRRILRKHLPEYPQWAEEKGISAIVKIFFTVRADGSIRKTVRVVNSSGYTELDQLAKEALLDWKFSPTEARSSTEEAWGVITFRFTLA